VARSVIPPQHQPRHDGLAVEPSRAGVFGLPRFPTSRQPHQRIDARLRLDLDHRHRAILARKRTVSERYRAEIAPGFAISGA
jgi:hypothetical protein